MTLEVVLWAMALATWIMIACRFAVDLWRDFT